MEQIKKLREITGAGILDCQKALKESSNIDEAIDYLRKKGLAKASKKSDREVTEGVLAIAIDKNQYSLVEVNCETDFVARNADFQDFSQQLAEKVLHSDIEEDEIKEKIAQFGENIKVGKVVKASTKGFFVAYMHNNKKLAVILEGIGDQAIAYSVAMHAAAMSPEFLDSSSVDSNALARERAIYLDELKDSNKPQGVIERIVDGKIEKYYEQVCLLNQKYVKDPSQKVSEFIKNKLEILSFKRFVLGER